MKKTFLVIALLAAIVFLTSCSAVHIGNTSYYTYANKSEYVATSNFKYSKDDVNKVSIDWICGQINIEQVDKKELSVKETTVYTEEKDIMHYAIIDGTLYIKFCESGNHNSIEDKKILNIEIPKDIELKVGSVSAGLNIGDAILNNTFKFSTVSGSFVGSKLTCDEIVFDSTSGRINIDLVNAKKVDINTVSGGAVLGIEKVSKIEMDTVSGSAKINMNGIGGTVKFSTVSGKYNLNEKSFGDRTVDIDFDSTSGNLTIEK